MFLSTKSWTKQALFVQSKKQRYRRKKTENHSLTFSTSTRQGGPQFAKSILAAALSIQYLMKQPSTIDMHANCMHKCFEKFKVCMHYSLLCEQIYSHCVRKYVHVHAVHARAFGTCILRITFLQCWCMFMQSINAWKTTKNIHLNQERTNDPLKLHTSGQESMESQPLSFFSHQNQGIFAASISNIDRNVRVKVLRFSGQATASRSYWCQNERRSKKHRTYNLTEWNGRNKNAILGTPIRQNNKDERW